MSLRSDSSSTDTMLADAARAPFVVDLLSSRWKSYDGARDVLRYAVVNLRKKLCVTPARWRAEATAEVRGVRPPRNRRAAARESGRAAQGDAAGAFRAALRGASTVLRAQFRKKDWHPRLGSGVHADAIMDRIVHSAVWLEMGGMNMRQAMGGKGR